MELIRSESLRKVNCLTIVIPTLLQPPKDFFQYSLEQYQNNDLVKKIIIIDNTNNKDFDKQYITTEKFEILKPSGNLGASCNAGMSHCDTEYYLQVNDDILCHKSILDDCYDIIENDKDIGLLQIHTINNQSLADYLKVYEQKQLKVINYDIPSSPASTMTGWFQFGCTKDWIDIPTELKNFGGDNLVLLRLSHQKRKIARLLSKHVSHLKATTVNSLGGLLTEHLEQDKIYRDLARKMFK